MSIDLGSERQMLTRYFGDDFENRLNTESETNSAIIMARDHLLSGEGKHLVGTRVESNDNALKVKRALNNQMGQPENFDWNAIGDSFVGRENDFMILVLGFNKLRFAERLRLLVRLKIVGVQFVLDE